ncbi:hypothetical protein HHI36_016968 [Cryptolaemus montrouzieri]|uniref:Uncharacterized protein n=1 Tax=Cryptolaemus montrouzieri TaxID=559131 RepID=A0ABD2NLB4_9CUCU
MRMSKKYCLVKFLEDNILYVVSTKRTKPIDGSLVKAPYKKLGIYEANIIETNDDKSVLEKKKSRLQNELMGIEDLNLSNLDLENVNDTVQPGNDNEDKNTSIYNTNNQLEKQLSYVEQSEEYDDLTKVSAGKDVNYPLTPGAEMETLSFIEDSDDSLQDPDFVVEQEISNTDYDESIIYGLENSDSANFERGAFS